MTAILAIVAGFAGILMGLAAWMGLLPTKPRTSYFKGGVHGEVMIMGFGVVILGAAGLYHQRALGLAAFAIVVAGFVLGLVSPSWLAPRWYKERYPDPPRDR